MLGSLDEETMQYLLSYSVLELWKNAFRYQKNNVDTTINSVTEEGMNGNKFHDDVVQTFLIDYEGAMDILAKYS